MQYFKKKIFVGLTLYVVSLPKPYPWVLEMGSSVGRDFFLNVLIYGIEYVMTMEPGYIQK
jgi:hypothetical protein